MQVESALLFETPVEICQRVFRTLRPRTRLPNVRVEFCAFANAHSFIKLGEGVLELRVTDLLAEAPAPILEALAYILIAKLYRLPVPEAVRRRYRLYLNRKDVRHRLTELRQERGRKVMSGPAGDHYNLLELFEDINRQYFHGLMARPALGWSLRRSRTLLGHYDPVHHAIVLSKLLDSADVPPLVVRYVMFHEMLHLRYPVEHRGSRRCVHTKEFREAEKTLFPELPEVKKLLRTL